MTRKYFWSISVFLMVSFFFYVPVNSTTANSSGTLEPIPDFSFLHTDGTNVSLYNFSGKPIILEWGASWCTVCEENQKAMNQLYPLYNDTVHFISLSYGGSGDNLQKVIHMKGSYQWTYGLDVNNVAAEHQVSNGYLWILDSNYTLVKDWRHAIAQASSIQAEINALLSPSEQQTSSVGDNDLLPFGNILFIGFVTVTVLFVVGIVALRINTILRKPPDSK